MTFDEYMQEQLKDPAFRKAYNDLQPEQAVMELILEARASEGLTRKELAKRTGIARTEISRLEQGKRNPSIKLLQRLADGLGKTLKIEFVPKEEEKIIE